MKLVINNYIYICVYVFKQDNGGIITTILLIQNLN